MTNPYKWTDAQLAKAKAENAPPYKIHKFLTMEDVLARGDVVSGQEESLTISEEAPDGA